MENVYGLWIRICVQNILFHIQLKLNTDEVQRASNKIVVLTFVKFRVVLQVFTVLTFGSRTSTASLKTYKVSKANWNWQFQTALVIFLRNIICISNYDGSNWTWRNITWHVDAGCNGPFIDFLRRNIAILSYFNGCRTRCMHDYTNKPRLYIQRTMDSRASD